MTRVPPVATYAAVLLLLGGCTKYLEEETPAGLVAPETVAPRGPYRTIRERTRLIDYHAERQASAEEVTVRLTYSGQGTVLSIRYARVTPARAERGRKVTFELHYSILAPSRTKSVQVRETWQLEKDGSVVTEMDPQLQWREPGGWRTRASILVPREAEPGTYIVRCGVAVGKSRQEQIAYFTVL